MNTTTNASVVVVHDNRILLVPQPTTGDLMFPGGHINADETAHEAATRAAYQATGIHTTIVATTDGMDLPPGFQVLPNPWMTVETTAPAQPGEPGEPEHRHIDLLYIGVPADPHALPTLAEASTAVWVYVGDLFEFAARHYDFRADVPTLAHAAWRHVTHHHTTRTARGQSVAIGNLTATSVHFGTVIRGQR